VKERLCWCAAKDAEKKKKTLRRKNGIEKYDREIC
jgi:hypothetical protein